MKNLSIGVVSSSRRYSGVSATSGRSPSTTSLSALPGKLRYCGPFGAALGEGDAAADRDPHGGEPGAAEEAAAIEVCSAAEGHRIGAFAIVLVEFLERALGLAGHGVAPWW